MENLQVCDCIDKTDIERLEKEIETKKQIKAAKIIEERKTVEGAIGRMFIIENKIKNFSAEMRTQSSSLENMSRIINDVKKLLLNNENINKIEDFNDSLDAFEMNLLDVEKALQYNNVALGNLQASIASTKKAI